MIVIDYIKQLKNSLEPNIKVNTFIELLNNAKKYESNKKIIEYFNTIKIKEKGNLIHLKYNNKEMFKRNWDEFYTKVRGLVVDWVNDDLVIYPWDKFYELGEHKSTEFSKVKKKYQENIENIELTEKIDGSLIESRNYKGEIITVSSGSFDGYHVDCAKKLIDYNTELKRFITDNSDYSIMFELKIKDLPQHIKYNEDSLTIIGMRNMKTLEVLYIKDIINLVLSGCYKVDVVKSFNIELEQVIDMLEDTNSKIEGYILRVDDLLVKLKTKNFILANRYKGEPSRNFNVLVDSINEGRTEALKKLINLDYLESFKVGIENIMYYLEKKNNKYNKMLEKLDFTLDNNSFAKEAQKLFPNDVKVLMSMKLKRNSLLSKEDIKHLKKFADKFTCVSHFKYAELNNINIVELENQLENGKISYLKSFEDTYTKQRVYIIHKWQWLSKDKLTSNL